MQNKSLAQNALCLAKSEIYDDIKKGNFPKPVKLSHGGKAVGWVASEIAEWQYRRIAERDGIAVIDHDFNCAP